MTDLHAALLARIEELERLAHVAAEDDSYSPDWKAKVVNGNDWSVESDSSQIVDSATEDDARHIAAWDPATVLRGLAEDRDILDRHKPCASHPGECNFCTGDPHDHDPYPCPDIKSLARRHNVEVES